MVALVGLGALLLWKEPWRRKTVVDERDQPSSPLLAIVPKNASEPGTAMSKGSAPAEEPKPPKQDPRDSGASILAEAANEPALRKLLAAQLRSGFSAQYSRIFDELGFSTAQKEGILSILAAQPFTPMDTILLLTSGSPSLTGDERQLLGGLLGQPSREAATAIEEFFRAEFPSDESKFESFKRSIEARPSETQVNALQSKLSESNERLTGDQAKALVAILNEERRGLAFLINDRTLDPAVGLGEKALEDRILGEIQVNMHIANRTAGLLSPAQQEALSRSLASRVDGMRNIAALIRQIQTLVK